MVMKLRTALIIPDCHIPYHHRKAYALMLKVARHVKPKEIIILGDYADFYAVSSYAKDPRLPSMLKEEIDAVNDHLDQLDELFPKAKKVYIEGNHENRLERYLCEKAPALFGYADCRELFKINQRFGWHWQKYGPGQRYRVLNSKLTARHTPLGSTAKASAAKALISHVFGHIHTIEESHIVGLNGDNHVAFSVGWLGDKRKDMVFDYVKNHHQWALGFGLVHVRPNGNFYREKIHILDDMTCVVNGKLFKI